MSSLGSLSVGSPQGLMLLYGRLTCRSGGHGTLSKTIQNDMPRGKQTCISRMASLNNIPSKDFFLKDSDQKEMRSCKGRKPVGWSLEISRNDPSLILPRGTAPLF